MSTPDTTKRPTGLALYSRAAEQSSAKVIDVYSTSFGWAAKLLSKPVKRHVTNIYALVRVADEIVDGAAAEAVAAGGRLDPGMELDALEAETYRAIETGFSTNLVVHAFALTARETGFGPQIIKPFFSSMRMDLTDKEHDAESFARYVYGSAEVVGLMCLAAFIKCGGSQFDQPQKLELARGAQALGAAFQKVNFLRDLAADFKALGRSYFPEVRVDNFDAGTRDRLVADIRADLTVSAAIVPMLPRSCRVAVAAAQGLFEELNERIARTPAEELIEARISVPNWRKLGIIAKAFFG